MYPENPEPGEKIEICLDEVAKELRKYLSYGSLWCVQLQKMRNCQFSMSTRMFCKTLFSK